MLILRSFSFYTPAKVVAEGIRYLRDTNKNDWYESQKSFQADTLKIVYDTENIIISAAKDVSGLWPEGASVAEISADDVPAAFDINGSWIFDGTGIKARTYSASEWLARAESERQSLLTVANDTIADWRTELGLGVISEEDKTSLTAWMIYIKTVKQLDLSGVFTEKEYNDLVWPEIPDVA